MKGIIKKIGAIIALKRKGGQKEMSLIMCPNCEGGSQGLYIEVQCKNQARVQGIIKCLRCEHEWPVTIDDGYIKKLDTELPAVQSDQLSGSVASDIQDDVREAERAYYSQCYKASVTMCRRALQLGLIDKGIKDGPLSGMLENAKKLLEQKTYDLATSIKGYGDIGAHRRE